LKFTSVAAPTLDHGHAAGFASQFWSFRGRKSESDFDLGAGSAGRAEIWSASRHNFDDDGGSVLGEPSFCSGRVQRVSRSISSR
jgi:hypothetical protein